jgi:RNA polymerase sigma-70 factor (sigma-E family)
MSADSLSPEEQCRNVQTEMDRLPLARAGPSSEAEDVWLERLYASEAATLVRLARFFVDDRSAAEDLVQEAFIRLSAARQRLRDEAAAAAYLRAIVLNLARDHNRRGLMSLRHRPPADPDDVPVEDQVASREDARRLVGALRELPRRQRDCIVLRYYLELPVPEVAGTLGLSVNSVKTHLQRGLRALEARLGPSQPPSPAAPTASAPRAISEARR